MLWLFSADLSLYVLSLLSFKDVFALYQLSRDIHQFLVDHETSIFHQLAILHRFVTAGITLEDAVRAEDGRGAWLRGAQSWKELCQRWVVLEHSWSGKGKVVEGGYLTFEDTVKIFQVDETDNTILAVLEHGGKQSLAVHTLDDGRRLWSLQGVTGFALSGGYLILSRNNGGLEIWRRAVGVPQSSASHVADGIQLPLRAPSPLALTPQQEEWLQRAPIVADTRGRFVPHGFVSSFTGTPFRLFLFRYPILVTVDRDAPHILQLYDVEHGTLKRMIDLDKLVQALKPVGHASQADALLLDIDMSDKLLVATFHNLVLITTIDSSDETVEATIFEEEMNPLDARKLALRLVKEERINLELGVAAPVTRSHVLSIPCRASGAMEPYNIVPPIEDDSTTDEFAIVRAEQRSPASYFITGKFSPNGRHLIVGTARGHLFLLPDVDDTLSGLTKFKDTAQNLKVGEPLRDVLWEAGDRRFIIRTEPGDIFLVDVNPGYHKDIALESETHLKLEGAAVHRLSDFCSLYGTCLGNMQMTRTRAWFVWDSSKLHEDAMDRMYPGKDRQIERAYMNKEITVCFMDFTPTTTQI